MSAWARLWETYWGHQYSSPAVARSAIVYWLLRTVYWLIRGVYVSALLILAAVAAMLAMLTGPVLLIGFANTVWVVAAACLVLLAVGRKPPKCYVATLAGLFAIFVAWLAHQQRAYRGQGVQSGILVVVGIALLYVGIAAIRMEMRGGRTR